MKKLSIAYFGTPYFSARFLEKILTDTTINRLIEVKLVVTQPDQPVGRKQTLSKTPVKVVAEKNNIAVIDDLKKLQVKSYKLKEMDFAFLFAYGGLIQKELLNLPKYGFLNTHPSLLPKYRGASPMVYPLIIGDTKTGVTLIKLDEEIDHGPIIAQEEMEITSHDRRPDLEVKLSDLAFEMFKKTTKELISTDFNRFKLIQQNHSGATFTRKLEKDDGFIPFSTLKKTLNKEPLTFNELPQIIKEYVSKYEVPYWRRPINNGIFESAKVVYNLYRGLFPWPGIWTKVIIKDQERRLKITDLTIHSSQLTIKSVQLEGKKEVNFKMINSAYRLL
ncbi:methionyl-tRNA formyltransferase [Candidatus Gottesmanbacteria bacterium]|nr:methionyl-tRNA formyltransferase [Candidatus Gottesmanbacteria bacterium]